MSAPEPSSEAPSVEELKQALLDDGFEIYRMDGTAIVLAERVRMHLMESGVSLEFGRELRVSVRVRTQRTDHPGDDDATMLQRVRSAINEAVTERGFTESGAASREIMHPGEEGTVLDVWHEVTFSKVVERDALHEHLRWALALPRCVTT